MSKAEEKAYECFPNEDIESKKARFGFLLGYHQVEKDLTDKAIGWIKEINTHHHIMRYSDSCEPPLSELTEWFKNYMKKENINSK